MTGSRDESSEEVDHNSSAAYDWKTGAEIELQFLSWPSSNDSDSTVPLAFTLLPVSF
jgi:hypothetical protein